MKILEIGNRQVFIDDEDYDLVKEEAIEARQNAEKGTL